MLGTYALSGSSPCVRSPPAASSAPCTDRISPSSVSVGDALRKRTQAPSRLAESEYLLLDTPRGESLTEIVRATSRSDVDAARRLFAKYAASLDIDLGFQDFASELEGLPGEYVPPSSALLLAMEGEEAAGCVALRPFEALIVAEIKRLYVVPAARDRGHGILLAEAAIDAARAAGYALVRLDTLSSMQAAQRLYEGLGFSDIDAYRHNPHEVRYLELTL
jgi:putative acetyltransferase